MPVVNQGYTGNLNRAIVLHDSWLARPVTSITWSHQTSGGQAVNIVDPATYNYWLPSAAPSYVQFDLGASRQCNTLGIAAHNAATNGGGIQLLSSNNGVDFSNTIVSYSPVTNDDIVFLFPTMTARYFRIRQTGNPFSIGVAFLATRLNFPCTPVDSYKPTHHAKRYRKRFNNSVAGHMLGNRVVSAGGETSVSFPLVARDWVDGPLTNFEDWYNRGNTFFYAGWPGGKPQDCAYAWAGSDDSIVEVEYNHADKLASVSFDMRFYSGT